MITQKKIKKKIIFFRANFNNYDDVKILNDHSNYKIKKYIFIDKKIPLIKNHEIIFISKKQITSYLESLNIRNVKNLSYADMNRVIKIYPFNFFKDADYFIYADSRISITGPLIKLINFNYDWIGLEHRFCKTIIDELKQCYLNNKINFEELKNFLKKKNKINQYSKFLENGFLIRKNNKKVRMISKIWLKNYLKGPRRDQLHLLNIIQFKKIKLNILSFKLNSKNSYVKLNSRNINFFLINKNRFIKIFRLFKIYFFFKTNFLKKKFKIKI